MPYPDFWTVHFESKPEVLPLVEELTDESTTEGTEKRAAAERLFLLLGRKNVVRVGKLSGGGRNRGRNGEDEPFAECPHTDPVCDLLFAESAVARLITMEC